MKLTSIFRNNNFRRVALASAVMLGIAGASNSFAVEATATTSTTVVTPINIGMLTNLNFGSIAASPSTGGSVTLTTGGALSATNAVLTNSTAKSVATFDIDGSANASFSVSVSDTDLTFTDANAATHTMALTPAWDIDAAASNSANTYSLDANGTRTLYLGGTLAVGAAQAAGAYAGNVTVSVEYN